LKTLIKWLLTFSVIIVVTILLFSAYANFFLSYSLERLEIAMDATSKGFDAVTPVSRNVYRDVLKDMAVEEATKENLDFKNVALLEMASNSLKDATEDAGYKRARYYLNQVLQSKLESRPLPLRILDRIYMNFQRTSQQTFSFLDYVKQRFLKSRPQQDKTIEYSSILLLNQADEKLKDLKIDEAAELYRKYLDRYPTQPERGFVSITLSDIYIKQNKLAEAKQLLGYVQQSFSGREEANIAGNMYKKIQAMEKNQQLINQLQNVIPAAQNSADSQSAQLKLALAHLSAYQTDKAIEILTPLLESPQSDIRQKAKFYLGWIYKLGSQYDKSTALLSDLLNDTGVNEQMRLGLQTQLADIYYQQGDVEKSADEYKNVSDALQKGAALPGQQKTEAGKEVWVALAELERAKIYRYNFDNAGEIEQLGRRLDELGLQYSEAGGDLKQTLESIPDTGLREKAFYELENGRVQVALDLFEKDAVRHPRDAWTHGGLGIVYVLLGDLEKGVEFAKQSYELDRDYYTAAVMGYLSALMGKYDDAELYYQEALGMKADYLPAKFNLASVYLKIGKFQQAIGLLGRLEQDLDENQKLIRAKILNNMGYAYWQLGDREKAQEKFKQSLEEMPNFSVAKNNLSQIAAGETPQMVTLRE
jgi:tetratricopeptide (TPR) repeat protein